MRAILLSAAVLLCAFDGSILAQTQPAPAETATPAGAPITIELNKLEDAPEGAGTSCRGYFIVGNPTAESLEELQIDVFVFDKDDVVLDRVALTFSGVRPGRTKVVLFDLKDLACGDIGRMLVNEVLKCSGPGGAATEGCADTLTVTTRAEAKFEY